MPLAGLVVSDAAESQSPSCRECVLNEVEKLCNVEEWVDDEPFGRCYNAIWVKYNWSGQDRCVDLAEDQRYTGYTDCLLDKGNVCDLKGL